MAKEILEDQWLKELRGCNTKPNDEGMTVMEMSIKTGHSQNWVREKLTRLNMEGKVTVGRKGCTMLDGRTTTVPCYKIKK